MKRLILTGLFGSLLLALPTAAEAPRDADTIWQEYEAIKMPAFDRTKIQDEAYLREYFDARRQAAEEQSKLALEFYRTAPADKRALPMMLTRWRGMSGTQGAAADKEIAEFLEKSTDPEAKAIVLYQQAMTLISRSRSNSAHDLDPGRERAEAFIQAYPKDERGAELLSILALRNSGAKKRTFYERIVADYPASRAAKMAEGNLRRQDGVGKPFELSFTEAQSGRKISVADLRGKVVVVDFWATWCGPCIAEMPKMKNLYSRYKDQGVEFIGVSLDRPGEGLSALKEYVTDNDIPWPQYYQGDGWESQFSLSWGVNAIPALFVVDAEGKLFSTEARSRLESVIDELIKKRDEKKPG